MIEDHAFEQGLDDLLFFGCELCDGFELVPKISIRATLISAKDQHICTHCLGACHEGGDVYRFVMKADGVDFREAHQRLGGHEATSSQILNYQS